MYTGFHHSGYVRASASASNTASAGASTSHSSMNTYSRATISVRTITCRAMGENGPQMIVEGSRVALGPVREDLAPTYARWVNDPEVRRGLATTSIYTVAHEED